MILRVGFYGKQMDRRAWRRDGKEKQAKRATKTRELIRGLCDIRIQEEPFSIGRGPGAHRWLTVLFPGLTVSHVDNHLFHSPIILLSIPIFSRVKIALLVKIIALLVETIAFMVTIYISGIVSRCYRCQ